MFYFFYYKIKFIITRFICPIIFYNNHQNYEYGSSEDKTGN